MEGIVRLRNSLDLLEIKLWSWLLFKNYYFLKSDKEFELSLSEIQNNIENSNETLINRAFTNLVSVPLRWSNYIKDEKINTELIPLLSYCIFKDEKVFFKFSSLFTEKMNSEEDYIKINMLIQNQFNSRYSKILYGLCLQRFELDKEFTEITIPVQQLRVYLELKDDEYLQFKEINRGILKKSLEEINDKSNLSAEIEYIKEKVAIAAIKLKIRLNKSNLISFSKLADKDVEEVKIDIFNNNELKDFLEKHNINVKIITNKAKELNEHGISYKDIAKYLFYIKNISKNKQILNSSYFISSLTKKQNIEAFLQTMAGQKVKESEASEDKLYTLYKAYELIGVIEYLKSNQKLFNQLIDKNIDNTSIKILKNCLTPEELANNFMIAKILIPEVQKMPDYDFISFDKWQQEYENSKTVLRQF